MAPPHVHLFGGFTITPGDGVLPLLTRTRQQAFLAYLLLHCCRPQARQTIAATFWPESGDAQAGKNLRVLLVEMRTAWPTSTTMCRLTARPCTGCRTQQ